MPPTFHPRATKPTATTQDIELPPLTSKNPKGSQIHWAWATALSLPPTSCLLSIRNLLRTLALPSDPSSLPPLALLSIALLYVDLALSYSFLGEYYLASISFQEAAFRLSSNQAPSDDDNNRRYKAFALFGQGLAKAELGEWEGAEKSWRRCLGCFEIRGGIFGQNLVLKRFSYRVCQGGKKNGGRTAVMSGSGFDNRWTLEREKVEWNFNVARVEVEILGMDVSLRQNYDQGDKYTVHNIPAGLHFGPDQKAEIREYPQPADSVVELSGSNYGQPRPHAYTAESSRNVSAKSESQTYTEQEISSPAKPISRPQPPKPTHTWPQQKHPSSKPLPAPLPPPPPPPQPRPRHLRRHPNLQPFLTPSHSATPIASPYDKSPLSFYFSPRCGEQQGEGEGEGGMWYESFTAPKHISHNDSTEEQQQGRQESSTPAPKHLQQSSPPAPNSSSSTYSLTHTIDDPNFVFIANTPLSAALAAGGELLLPRAFEGGKGSELEGGVGRWF